MIHPLKETHLMTYLLSGLLLLGLWLSGANGSYREISEFKLEISWLDRRVGSAFSSSCAA